MRSGIVVKPTQYNFERFALNVLDFAHVIVAVAIRLSRRQW